MGYQYILRERIRRVFLSQIINDRFQDNNRTRKGIGALSGLLFSFTFVSRRGREARRETDACLAGKHSHRGREPRRLFVGC